MQDTASRHYGAMDVAKFICALLIVTIHRKFGDISCFPIYEEHYVLARIAVPFFFASSSFLFFSKISYETGIQRLKNFSAKNLRIFVIWSLIYTPSLLYRNIVNLSLSAKDAVLRLPADYFTTPLWFLPALVISVCIVYFLSQKNGKIAFAFAAICFIGSLFAGMSIKTSDNAPFLLATLLRGIPYVYLGYFMSEKEIKTDKKLYLPLFLVFTATALAEGAIEFFLIKERFFALSRISYLPAVFFLMAFCITKETKPKKVYFTLRKLSILIYLIHLAILDGVMFILMSLTRFDRIFEITTFTKFLFTVLYTAAGCALILLLENKKGFRWLKKLYS